MYGIDGDASAKNFYAKARHTHSFQEVLDVFDRFYTRSHDVEKFYRSVKSWKAVPGVKAITQGTQLELMNNQQVDHRQLTARELKYVFIVGWPENQTVRDLLFKREVRLPDGQGTIQDYESDDVTMEHIASALDCDDTPQTGTTSTNLDKKSLEAALKELGYQKTSDVAANVYNGTSQRLGRLPPRDQVKSRVPQNSPKGVLESFIVEALNNHDADLGCAGEAPMTIDEIGLFTMAMGIESGDPQTERPKPSVNRNFYFKFFFFDGYGVGRHKNDLKNETEKKDTRNTRESNDSFVQVEPMMVSRMNQLINKLPEETIAALYESYKKSLDQLEIDERETGEALNLPVTEFEIETPKCKATSPELNKLTTYWAQPAPIKTNLDTPLKSCIKTPAVNETIERRYSPKRVTFSNKVQYQDEYGFQYYDEPSPYKLGPKTFTAITRKPIDAERATEERIFTIATVSGFVNGVPITLPMDSCSNVNVITLDFLRSLPGNISIQKVPPALQNTGVGGSVPILGFTYLRIALGESNFYNRPVKFYIMPACPKPILMGNPGMAIFRCNLLLDEDDPSSLMQEDDEQVKEKGLALVKLVDDLLLLPGHETMAKVTVEKAITPKNPKERACLIQGIESMQDNGIYCTNTIVDLEKLTKGEAVVLLDYDQPHAKKLPKGTTEILDDPSALIEMATLCSILQPANEEELVSLLSNTPILEEVEDFVSPFTYDFLNKNTDYSETALDFETLTIDEDETLDDDCYSIVSDESNWSIPSVYEQPQVPNFDEQKPFASVINGDHPEYRRSSLQTYTTEIDEDHISNPIMNSIPTKDKSREDHLDYLPPASTLTDDEIWEKIPHSHISGTFGMTYSHEWTL
ncbi:hypothetical protein BCR33DRAFT_863378 [Rhizoclosmatium globosum]|uniref:Uncharacterized protein n=1 Tax=Rhizoclosmatium globosum TaxID=329046 RepID=A0A1Y2A9G8_9FUNG|nr:hypothetical protein BCR33DRAFT_863378 [Rhizoclosmatium globosum]|eukprot:ORY19114.1 hypothetical protein BCR33DRAFT_863378 [Rhizoclosmatium globosum]